MGSFADYFGSVVFVTGTFLGVCIHTEKSFQNHMKSNRNQIVSTIFQLIWNSKRTCSFVFQINRKMVDTI